MVEPKTDFKQNLKRMQATADQNNQASTSSLRPATANKPKPTTKFSKQVPRCATVKTASILNYEKEVEK